MSNKIEKLFDDSGKSLNGKVTLEMGEAYHNCAANECDRAYITTTTVYIIDDGKSPARICSSDDDYDNEITFTVTWEITNADAESEEDCCDWSEYTITADNPGYDLNALLVD